MANVHIAGVANYSTEFMDVKVMNNAANNLRVLIAEMVEKSKSGHPGRYGRRGLHQCIVFKFPCV